MAVDKVTEFISENFIKVLWAICAYFLLNLSNDFKDVKSTLQQIVTSQAILEVRMSSKDGIDKKQDDRLDKIEEKLSSNKDNK